MRSTGTHAAHSPHCVADHRDHRGGESVTTVAADRTQLAREVVAAPGTRALPSSVGEGVGIRLTLRSTLNAPAAIHSGCGYTPSLTHSHKERAGSPADSDGTDMDVTDPLEQHFAVVKQCVTDCRETLLLAREWIANGGGGDQSGGQPNQEGAAVRLLRAVMDFEELCSRAGSGRRHGSGAARGMYGEEEEESSLSAVNVPGQVMCLLHQQQQRRRARRDGVTDGMDVDGERSDGAALLPSSASSSCCCSSADEDADAREEESEEDPCAVTLPAFLRFRRLFTRTPTVAAAPLLSEQLRYAPLLADMSTLARHLLMPLDVVRHHQRLWLFISEDVPFTLEEQLYHHRVVLSSARDSAKSGEAHDDVPAVNVQRLWSELWELLGALWRQRARLLGVFSAAMPPSIVSAQRVRSTATRGLSGAASPSPEESAAAMLLTSTRSPPPFLLPARHGGGPSVAAAAAVHASPTAALLTSRVLSAPPSAKASPYYKERYARHVSRFWRAQAGAFLRVENAKRRAAWKREGGCRKDGGVGQAATPSPPPSSAAREPPDPPRAADACRTDAHSLFGGQVYAADDGIALGPFTPTKVGVRPADSAGGRYVMREPLDALWRTLRCCCLPSPSSRTSSATELLTCRPFFDVCSRDVSGSAAVPYMAPEVYMDLCASRRAPPRGSCNEEEESESKREAASVKLALHSFSDDAWNAAVVVLEAALAGFSLTGSHLCRREATESASPPPAPSSSVFADTAAVLTSPRHGIPLEAAHNFLYATLHHFSALAADAEEERGERERSAADAHTPDPAQLAQEWWTHLHARYSPSFTRGLLRELCRTGLRWRREDRWHAFCDAHVPSGALTPPSLAAAAGSVREKAKAGGGGGGGGVFAAGERAPLTIHLSALPLAHEPMTPTSPGSPQLRTTTITSTTAHGQSHKMGAVSGDGHDDHQHNGNGNGNGSSSSGSPAGPSCTSQAENFLSPSATLQGAWSTMSPDSVAVPAGATRVAGGGGAVADAHTLKLLDRTERQLDLLQVPLLPVVPRCPTSHKDAAAAPYAWSSQELWERFRRWRRLVEQAAVHASGSHGAVGPQRQSILFTELIRLGRDAIMLSYSDGSTSTSSSSSHGAARYAVADHPFVRGVVERGQLPAYASLVPCKQPFHTDDGSSSCRTVVPLSTPTLFIPRGRLQVLFDRVDEAAGAARRAQSQRLSSPLAPASAPQRVGALQVLLGDTRRVRPAGALLRRHGGSWPDLLYPVLTRLASRVVPDAREGSSGGGALSCFSRKATTTAATETLREAAWGLTREVDVNVALQLRITGQLRQIFLTLSSPQATAAATRAYLGDLQEEMQVCLVPVPATLRGEVWGALLGVPPPRKREALYAAVAPVHRTSADRQIAVDTPRCHQYHPLLSTEEGQEKLQRVLKAWLLMPRDTPLGYWQGLDSVCAVLLTASYTDEALVLAQLDAVVRHLIAHRDATASERRGVEEEDAPAPPHHPAAAAPAAPTPPPASLLAGVTAASVAGGAAAMPTSMEAALRQFGVTLRYCDPLLATHIFVLDCPPQLFAISWLLTLFAHSLPARQVYLLWDYLFLHMHDNPHCLACMCCAFLLQKRTSIMGQDASGVLAALGSGGQQQQQQRSSIAPPSSGGKPSDVVAVLVDTAVLLRAIPPCIGHQPEELDRSEAHGHAPSSSSATGGARGPSWQSLLRSSEVAFMDVATLLTAFTPRQQRVGREDVRDTAAAAATGGQRRQPHRQRWWAAGVYLVDLRVKGADRVLGSISLPLAPPSPHEAAREDDSPLPKLPARSSSTAGHPHARERERHNGRDHHDRRQPSLVFERDVCDVAAELTRQLRNPAMAAVPPSLSPGAAAAAADARPHRDVDRHPDPSPLALKTAHSPHVVLLDEGGRFEGRTEGAPYSAAQSLALELMRCGVHNVSILLGGVELVKQQAPWLIVPG